jgi:hypothetical protein
MSGWDVLNNIIIRFPPVAATLMLVAIGVLFIIGFSRHGMDFIKHGFGQNLLSELISKLATKEDIAGLRNEVKADMAGLRDEFKADMAGLRNEVKADMAGLRNEVKSDISRLETELTAIKVNHFGHLKNFLTELTSILVDRGIINNENKTRLDNHLCGM